MSKPLTTPSLQPSSVNLPPQNSVITGGVEGLSSSLIALLGSDRLQTSDVQYVESNAGIFVEFTAQKVNEPVPSVARVSDELARVSYCLVRSDIPWKFATIFVDGYNAHTREADTQLVDGKWSRETLQKFDASHFVELCRESVYPVHLSPNLKDADDK